MKAALAFSRHRISLAVELLRLLWFPVFRRGGGRGPQFRPSLSWTLDGEHAPEPSRRRPRVRVRGSTPGAEWFQRENAKQTEPFEAPRSPVNTPRGVFIWVVIVSAKPTKCLQPASPRCTRCKTGNWIFG